MANSSTLPDRLIESATIGRRIQPFPTAQNTMVKAPGTTDHFTPHQALKAAMYLPLLFEGNKCQQRMKMGAITSCNTTYWEQRICKNFREVADDTHFFFLIAKMGTATHSDITPVSNKGCMLGKWNYRMEVGSPLLDSCSSVE